MPTPREKRKSLVGWTYENWEDNFHKDTCPHIEMALPALYKEKHILMKKVRITIEEI